MIYLASGPTAPPPATRGSVWLPIVATAPVDQVATFYDMLRNDARQQRPRLEVCQHLEAAAAWKAADIVANGYWSHRSASGEWPNTTAKRFGCQLPDDYSDGWNGCESLVGGAEDAGVMYNALIGSTSHRPHLLGETDFFRRQTHCGIACAVGGRYGWVWAVYIAACQC